MKRSFITITKNPKYSSWFDVKTHRLEPQEILYLDKSAMMST